MIKDKIRKGVHLNTTDTIVDDLQEFQRFLSINFKKLEHYG